MASLQQNVWMKIGTSIMLEFGPVLNPDGTYANLTGATAKWGLAKNPTSATALLVKDSVSNPADVQVTSSPATYPDTNGYSTTWTVNVVLHPNDTKTLPPSIRPNKWYHECRVTDSLGNVTCIAIGDFHLQPSPL